jgi:aminopeptidase N
LCHNNFSQLLRLHALARKSAGVQTAKQFIFLLMFTLKLIRPFFLFLFFFSVLQVSGQAPVKNFNRERTFDVQHYTIRTNFDRRQKTVFGDTTVLLKPLRDDFKTIELDSAAIKYESVRLEPENINLNYRLSGQKIIIALDRAYSAKDSISIRFKYSAKPQKGIYFIEPLIENGKVERDAQIWTQGEPEEAHHWFPSYDFPDDKATSEQIITVEKGETVIANGELLEKRENANGTVTFHYKMPVPHSTYLTSFVVGKYAKISDSYKNIPLGFYVYPGTESIVPIAYGQTKDMFRIFEEMFEMPYPFNKYDQTMVANFNFGGMENITATTMADTEILFARFNKGAVEDLVAHELAHAWFGNLVTCRNWAELWLNEGFATFLEAAYREKMYGRADYIRKIREDVAGFFAFDSTNKKRYALFNTLADPNVDDSLFNTVTYQKGGAVIHTLRETVGEEAFWKALKVYLNRHKFGNAETPDLQKVFEETSGRNLDWFFRQWVYSAGFPQIEIQPVYNPAAKTLNLTVTQTQKTEGNTPNAYVLPLEVEIQTASGAQTEKLEINRRAQNFSVQLKAKPENLSFDKFSKLPLLNVKAKAIAVSNVQR